MRILVFEELRFGCEVIALLRLFFVGEGGMWAGVLFLSLFFGKGGGGEEDRRGMQQ